MLVLCYTDVLHVSPTDPEGEKGKNKNTKLNRRVHPAIHTFSRFDSKSGKLTCSDDETLIFQFNNFYNDLHNVIWRQIQFY